MRCVRSRKPIARTIPADHDCSELQINGPVIWSKVAQCHHDLGNLDDAQECYEAVIDAEPDNLAAKLGLAKVLELQSDPQGALEMLSQGQSDVHQTYRIKLDC